MIGDFNDIASSLEKSGDGERDARSIQNFRDMMNCCKIKAVASKGNAFTWDNKRENGANVRERIDRVMTNIEWIEYFPKCVVQHLPMIGSDHCPLIFQQEVKEKKAKRNFKFELIWSEEKECEDVVKESWPLGKEGSYSFRLMKKLRICSKGLIQWSRKYFANNMKAIEKLKEKNR